MLPLKTERDAVFFPCLPNFWQWLRKTVDLRLSSFLDFADEAPGSQATSYRGVVILNRSQRSNEGAKPTAFGTYWRAGQTSEILAATVCMPEFTGPEHQHSEAQLAILLSGSSVTFSSRALSGSVSSPMAPGSFAYLHPGQSHVMQWHDWAEILNLYWEVDSLRELADQSGSSLEEEPASYHIDSAIHSVGRILMGEFLQVGTLSEMMIDHGRALAASRLFRLGDKQSSRLSTGLLPRKRLESAVSAMVANPEKNFTLLELARLCHSSLFHFSRSFKAHLGYAPFAFQRNLRIQKAKAMLLTTDLSVEAIGQAVGIDIPTSFSRIFRRSIGHSPRQHRQLHAEKTRSHRA